MFFHLSRSLSLTRVLSAHEISPMFSLLILYTGCLFADFVQWILKNASNGTHGCVRDFDVEAFKNFRNSFRKPFGIGQNNWTSQS